MAFPSLTEEMIFCIRRYGGEVEYGNGKQLSAAGQREAEMFVVLTGGIPDLHVRRPQSTRIDYRTELSVIKIRQLSRKLQVPGPAVDRLRKIRLVWWWHFRCWRMCGRSWFPLPYSTSLPYRRMQNSIHCSGVQTGDGLSILNGRDDFCIRRYGKVKIWRSRKLSP